jgi:hypothetical protein
LQLLILPRLPVETVKRIAMPSRVQADCFPAIVFAGEEEAVVQTVFSVEPEFNLFGLDAVAFPIGGPGHFSRMLCRELANLGF